MQKFSKIRIISLLVLTLFMIASVGYASSITKIEKIMEVYQNEKGEIVGDKGGKNFNIDKSRYSLKVNLDYPDDRYVRLMSRDKTSDYLSFFLEKAPFFRVYKLTTNEKRDFILVLNGKQSPFEPVCTGAWVIGVHKGELVTFLDHDRMKKAGLVFQEISPSLANGELILMGIARERDCRVWSLDGSEVIGYQYEGRTAYPSDPGYCNIMSVAIFWDDDAQWFGIREY